MSHVTRPQMVQNILEEYLNIRIRLTFVYIWNRSKLLHGLRTIAIEPMESAT